MIKFKRKMAIATILLSVLQGCNNSSTTTEDEPPTLPPAIEPSGVLDLDFTLSLKDMGVSEDKLVGATFDTDVGEFLILGQDGLLVSLSTEGVIERERLLAIEGASKFSGIEYIDTHSFIVSSEDSTIYIVEHDSLAAEKLTQLDFRIGAIAYDHQAGMAVVVDDRSPSSLVFISLDGSVSVKEMNTTLSADSVEGLTVVDDTLIFAASYEENNESFTVVATSSFVGEVGMTWRIDSDTTTGLVVLDHEIPEILTTNSGSEQLITLYEPPAPPSVPTEDLLQLISSPNLAFDQPSGIDFNGESSELWYVTDFGEVRRGNTDGPSELIHELEAMQGSFESIVAFDDKLSLMMSDDSSDESTIVTLDKNGNLIGQFEIPVIDNEHQFESLGYDEVNEYFVAITSNEGTKVVYQFTESRLLGTVELPDSYDEFTISGITVSPDTNLIYFVTEEWEDENETLNAGLVIKLDYTTFEEINRLSVAIEDDGEIVGVKNPSDIAIDNTNNRIFITSDVDDSILYVFEAF